MTGIIRAEKGRSYAVMASTSPAKPKLHGRAFYESIGSPKFVVAPMVDQSEFAWRMLTRSFLTAGENAKLLAYTPMFHARLFDETARYRDSHFQATRQPLPAPSSSQSNPSSPSDQPAEPAQPMPFLDGNPRFDRPLFVQFCANDPQYLLSAAEKVAPYCDAVDLNLGCPQGIAKRGHYGAFLQEDQELVYKLIHTLHEKLPVPVTAKIRILETKEATLAYARNVLAAGASILTVHGRRRDQKGHLTGVADWAYLRYLRENLPPDTVMFANGNILEHGDLERCLAATGADAVMSAEGNLSNPAIFAAPPPEGYQGREYWRGRDGRGGWRVDAVFRRYMDLIHTHVLQQEPPTRRPLFVPGDDEGWLREEEAQEGEDGPPTKKRKRDCGGGGGGGGSKHEMSPNLVAVRPHLFHLLRHFISRHTDIRDALARTHAGDVAGVERVLGLVERRVAEGLAAYARTDGRSLEEEPELKPKKTQLPASATASASASAPASAALDGVEQQQPGSSGGNVDGDDGDPESSAATVKACKRPWWVAQPIVRPLPKEALAKGSIALSRKEKRKQEMAAAAAAAVAATASASDSAGNGHRPDARHDGKTEAQQSRRIEDELPKSDGVDHPKEPPMDTKKPGLVNDDLVCG
ncbi:hypothetical protein GGR56DRAFT_664457 [Xylariaceae sp. FL0804]|nr:hypothetical protein GGR56DRAFT_664457 [Xylariaceae sp. FL0804]